MDNGRTSSSVGRRTIVSDDGVGVKDTDVLNL